MLKTLLLSRLAAMFSGNTSKNGKKKGPGRIVLMVILMMYVMGVLFALMFGLFTQMMPALAAQNAQWTAFAFAAIGGSVMSLLFDIPMAQAQLYGARDNEMLLAMPIPSWMILFSRMLALYGMSLLYAMCFYLPALIVCAMYMTLSAPDILCFLLAALVMQLLPLALSCIVARFFAYLKARFPRSQIISALFMGLLMCVYFYFCGNMNEVLTALADNAAVAAVNIRTYAYPFYAFGRASLGDWTSLLTLAGVCILIFAPVYFYLSRTFTRVVTVSSPIKGEKAGDMRAHSPFMALTLREMRHFTASSMYMMNAGLGLMLELFAGVFFLLRSQTLLAQFNGLFSSEGLCALIAMALCLISAMDVISAPSISLERESIWVVQSLPVKPSSVLFAKAACHFFICAPVSIVTSILFAIPLAGIGAAGWAIIIVLPLLMNAFCALLGVCMNLLFPRLDFINDVAVVKRSGSVICTMFMGWAVVGLPVLAHLMFLSGIFSAYTALALYGVLLALACIPMALHLNGRGARKFAHLS